MVPAGHNGDGLCVLSQEELAFMYEMLCLYEDCLVQYDELDALFTQFVLNHAVGGIVNVHLSPTQHL